ncbi:hypothetical protein AX17_000680 [Amanita inopinata Kibby_2008]|nr:hypothetical protein AX17_000680 [Amanita inopinata Kibby_2008]
MEGHKLPHHFTAEEIALREQRKAKKFKVQQENYSSGPDKIIERPWICLVDKQKVKENGMLRIKVLTFNLLAQCLVRRELFPTSNCLRASQREPMLHCEILSQNADIVCLQEVDRLEKLMPILEAAGYSHHYAVGLGKKHGCLIAFKKKMFTKVSDHLVHYDEGEVRTTGDDRARRGQSCCTKNIASLVALKNVDSNSQGLIVATTHLFWHPKYTYERVRQAGILLREVASYRARLQRPQWPCIVTGDFNFAPDDPAYSLLVGDPLLPEQEKDLIDSQVVHVSVDPTVSASAEGVLLDNDEGEDGVDPDRVITRARAATSADGLLSTVELQALYSQAVRPRSVYDIGLHESGLSLKETLRTFGDRVSILPGRHGSFEPEYTSYTHYWKAVLDYIFVLDPPEYRSQVLALLAPHRTENLESGLPQMGVCGSDHISLAAELHWQPID